MPKPLQKNRGLLAFLFFLVKIALPQPAPGGPGIAFSRPTSEKQGFGTAYEAYDDKNGYSPESITAPISRVWFTLARGIVTEVYFPRADTPQVRDLQILITDGKKFLHQEQYDTLHEVKREPSSPLYKVNNRDRDSRYIIEKEIWADPDSDTLVQHFTITKNVDGLQFYVLHKPTAANSTFGDSAFTQPGLYAGQDHERFGAWQSLSSDLGWESTSVGYVGVNDGYKDLLDRHMDFHFTEARNGNVALLGKLPISPKTGKTSFSLYLHFEKSEADLLKRFSPSSFSISRSRSRFVEQWQTYLKNLTLPLGRRFQPKRRDLVVSSALLLKSAEDKNYSGSVIASPSFPWGESYFETNNLETPAGYSVVWPRDLYHCANAFIAIGDFSTAKAILERFRQVQYQKSAGDWVFLPRVHSKAGSFPQNFWVDGVPLYSGYQADETAMPVLLAHRLWKKGAISPESYWPMVREAARFLFEFGPWTQTERWEENYGISPNSGAHVIAALAAAGEMAAAVNEDDWATRFSETAKSWARKPGDNIDTWTFTDQGKIQGALGNGKYYLRLEGAACNKENADAPIFDAIWNPKMDEPFCLANYSAPERYKWESEMVDAGFLALARLGIHSAKHSLIQESLQEVDTLLKRDTPTGPGWYRYRFDAYGENHHGRLWPLLTGERLHFELQELIENGVEDLASAMETKIQSLESFASAELLFSEQVWDEGPLSGRPTGSATPLLWSHAEYLELLRSIKDGKVLDQIDVFKTKRPKG